MYFRDRVCENNSIQSAGSPPAVEPCHCRKLVLLDQSRPVRAKRKRALGVVIIDPRTMACEPSSAENYKCFIEAASMGCNPATIGTDAY